MKYFLISLLSMIGLLNTPSVLASNKAGVALDQGFGVVGQFSGINELVNGTPYIDDYLKVFLGTRGMSVDYIVNQGEFSPDLLAEFYVGAGAYYDWDDINQRGLRMPVGVTLPLEQMWEVYGQVSPSLSLQEVDVLLEFYFSFGLRHEF